MSRSIKAVQLGAACDRSARGAARGGAPRRGAEKTNCPENRRQPLDSSRFATRNGSNFLSFLSFPDARVTRFGNSAGAKGGASAAFRRGVPWESLGRRSISLEVIFTPSPTPAGTLPYLLEKAGFEK